jgi:fatty acid desaturase
VAFPPENDNLGPLSGYGAAACLARFILSAVFGFALALLVLALWGWAGATGAGTNGPLVAILLVGAPVAWGLIGIFYLRPMLDLARTLVEYISCD